MKCENCGKNEVNFIYQSSINGRTEERHLCSECAEKLGYTNAVAAHSRRMMQSFFGGGLMDDLFSPQPFLRPFFGEDLFDDFFQQMPLVEEKEQSRFARMRQLNALKLEQKAAVLREDFEKAAQLRDQIRELEQEKKSGSAGQDRPRSE